MERLVEEETYREYVEGRKRLSIQTGFSDAGRFIGQIPATLAIERYYHGLAALVDKAKLDGCRDADLLDARRVDGPRRASGHSLHAASLSR